MVLGNSEKKKKMTPRETKMGPGNEFRHPLSKISQYLEIINDSGKLYQSTEKSEHNSHMRQTEGLTKTFEESSKSRGVFRTQVNICDGAFL